ncbi:hypothetical protein D0T49_12995 [Paludibacter sp. 221]|nr:hypothetical protein [Paludibacter sp. 221]
MEALAGESNGGGSTNENWGCGGNPTYVPNQTLKHVVCITFWRDKLKCKTESRVCCDPAKQTNCNGDLISIGF